LLCDVLTVGEIWCEWMNGQASYIFDVAVPPLAGNCSIFPTEGYVDDTMFVIACNNFYDEDQSLHYMFFVEKCMKDPLHPHGKLFKQ